MVSVAVPDLAASLYSEAGLAGQQDRERQRTKNMIYETSTHSEVQSLVRGDHREGLLECCTAVTLYNTKLPDEKI